MQYDGLTLSQVLDRIRELYPGNEVFATSVLHGDKLKGRKRVAIFMGMMVLGLVDPDVLIDVELKDMGTGLSTFVFHQSLETR